MAQSLVCLNYHLIFSTKRREPILLDAIRPRLYEYVGGILRSRRSILIAAGGMPDHTHWLVSLHQQTSVADILREMKASSSKWLHDLSPEMSHFAWQAGYAAFAVSYSNLTTVEAYIRGQAEHHRTISFQEELLAFLRRHGIVYDERYLWD
jgi:REP-associated tyrosine transposase